LGERKRCAAASSSPKIGVIVSVSVMNELRLTWDAKKREY